MYLIAPKIWQWSNSQITKLHKLELVVSPLIWIYFLFERLVMLHWWKKYERGKRNGGRLNCCFKSVSPRTSKFFWKWNSVISTHKVCRDTSICPVNSLRCKFNPSNEVGRSLPFASVTWDMEGSIKRSRFLVILHQWLKMFYSTTTYFVNSTS